MAGDGPEAEPFLAASRRHDAMTALLHHAETIEGRDDRTLPRRPGAACEAVGRPDEARAWFRLTLARDPLDDEAQRALFRLGPLPASAQGDG